MRKRVKAHATVTRHTWEKHVPTAVRWTRTQTCHVTCPMFQGQICGGNGECFIKTTGKVSVGICKCDVGFVGPNCQGTCPRHSSGEDGAVCSGHGSCSFNQHQRTECSCDEGWVSN